MALGIDAMVGITAVAPPSSAGNQVLAVDLLGPPRVTWAGRPRALARRQARALLYRLAAAPGPVPRDRLAFLLWPDSPDSVARRNLVVLLTHLRHALPHPDLLTAIDGAVGLRHDRARSDAVIAAAAIDVGLRERQLDRLAAAVSLYRGPFLDGFALPDCPEFEDWIAGERREWERRYLTALDALAEGHTARGDYPAAILAARRALEVDPLAEEIHRRLIALHTALGDRAAAARQFRDCAATLQRELNVRPHPSTSAAYETARGDGAPRPEHLFANPQGAPAWRVPTKSHAATMAAVLPAPPNPLIGREAELAAMCHLLVNGETRLLTLCGPGGSGKTRLALEVAWEVRGRFADGVVFVPLAPLADPDAVAEAIARACGTPQSAATSLLALLRDHLRDKQLLLVLDNFEHLVAAAPLIAGLLAEASHLSILVTSRAVLNLQGECTIAVSPLPLPDLSQLSSLTALSAQPAVALLLARARAHTPSLQLTEANAADLASICARLDGLPLALELAAARLRTLAPRELLVRLDRRLSLLDRGPRDLPDRHQALREAIAWSGRLLDPGARRLFARLAVFAGGWTLPAAEQICRARGEPPHTVLNDLQALCEAHLVARHDEVSGEARYTMLETIREYALEQLHERGEWEMLRLRHAAYFRRFAERRMPRLWTAAFPTALGEFDRDRHNLRSALGGALAAGAYQLAARLADALVMYWDAHGLLEEGHAWCARVLSREAVVPQPFRSRLRAQAAFLAYRLGRPEDAGIVAATVLADAGADAIAIVSAANVAGQSALEAGDLASARRHYVYGIAVAQEQGSAYSAARLEFNLGFANVVQGDLAEAEALFRRSYARREELGHPRTIGMALIGLGLVAVLQRAPRRAAQMLGDSVRQLVLAREKTHLLYAFLACGALATLRQQPRHAAALFAAATEQAERIGLTFPRGVEALVRLHADRAREQLVDDEFERAWREGRALSFDSTVALALAVAEFGKHVSEPDTRHHPTLQADIPAICALPRASALASASGI